MAGLGRPHTQEAAAWAGVVREGTSSHEAGKGLAVGIHLYISSWVRPSPNARPATHHTCFKVTGASGQAVLSRKVALPESPSGQCLLGVV